MYGNPQRHVASIQLAFAVVQDRVDAPINTSISKKKEPTREGTVMPTAVNHRHRGARNKLTGSSTSRELGVGDWVFRHSFVSNHYSVSYPRSPQAASREPRVACGGSFPSPMVAELPFIVPGAPRSEKLRRFYAAPLLFFFPETARNWCIY